MVRSGQREAIYACAKRSVPDDLMSMIQYCAEIDVLESSEGAGTKKHQYQNT